MTNLNLVEIDRNIAAAKSSRERLSRVRQRALARPEGSLGRIDEVIHRLSALRGVPIGTLQAGVSVLAADHGVSYHGTSTHESNVTAAILKLIQADKAPINILAEMSSARVESADFGLFTDVGDTSYKVAHGSADILECSAMSVSQAETAILNGIDYSHKRLSDFNLLGVGEIGVGNTTSAAALASWLLELPPDTVVGPGSGVNEQTVRLKCDIITAALARSKRAGLHSMIEIAASLGGFEICGNVGVILGAAQRNTVIVIDGFITGVAALIATSLSSKVRHYLIAAHRSAEPGHRHVLDALGLSPLLELDMRLGMGSGAAMALPLIQMAQAVGDKVPTARQAGLLDA